MVNNVDNNPVPQGVIIIFKTNSSSSIVRGSVGGSSSIVNHKITMRSGSSTSEKINKILQDLLYKIMLSKINRIYRTIIANGGKYIKNDALKSVDNSYLLTKINKDLKTLIEAINNKATMSAINDFLSSWSPIMNQFNTM